MDFTVTFEIIFKAEKFHQKVKMLTRGFSQFFDQFQTFEIRPKYESLGRIRQFWRNLRDFTVIFEIIFKAEKFHQKVKMLTRGFSQFFDQFQTFEIRPKYESLGRIR